MKIDEEILILKYLNIKTEYKTVYSVLNVIGIVITNVVL